ncbi:MAG: extracellular solute-binding protein [Microbacterium sp.]|jgi:ABC-type glycerol-3-phosphate transport system substrate-binding protein|nr:extracellular solute-binding protein [Microbacterium sp.]
MRLRFKGEANIDSINAGRRHQGLLVAAMTALVALPVSGCGTLGQAAPTRTAVPISTELGSDPVTITARVNEDQSALWEALAEGFESENPSVTVELETEAFATLQQNAPRYLAAQETPDLLRLAAPGDAVKNDLLLNLDPYAEAYGWDEFPKSQLEQWTIANDGRVRGEGSLYGMGVGFGVVGVYYNKEKYAALGFDEPPATLKEFESMLAEASAAGTTAIIGNVSYLFQGVAQSLGAAGAISSWVFNQPEASIDTPETIEAAATIQRWVEAGYFPRDFGSADPNLDFGRFTSGESLFFHNGSWFAAGLDATAPGSFGFFLLPPASAEDGYRTMAAPNAVVIPANAKHPNEAAAFLNWVNSETAREILAGIGGLVAGGSADMPAPPTAPGTVFAETVAAFEVVTADDGIVDFLANATAGMGSGTLEPQGDLLVAEQVTPQQYVEKLQADYLTAVEQ